MNTHNGDYQVLLDRTIKLIDNLRQNHQLSPHVTLTVDSLFSSCEKPLDSIDRNIYLCVATKKDLAKVLSHKLPHQHHRLFTKNGMLLVVYHHNAILSQATTVYRVDFDARIHGALPPQQEQRTSDQGLLSLGHLANIDPNTFERTVLASHYGLRGKSLVQQLSAIGNVSDSYVKRLFEAHAAQSADGAAGANNAESLDVTSRYAKNWQKYPKFILILKCLELSMHSTLAIDTPPALGKAPIIGTPRAGKSGRKSGLTPFQKQEAMESGMQLLGKHNLLPEGKPKCTKALLQQLALELRVVYASKWSIVDGIRELGAISTKMANNLDSTPALDSPDLPAP